MVIGPAGLRMEGGTRKVASMTASQLYEWRSSVLACSDALIQGAMVAGKLIACERCVIYYEAIVKPGDKRRCDML